MKYFGNILKIFENMFENKEYFKNSFFYVPTARWRPWANNNPWLEDQNNNDSSAK